MIQLRAAALTKFIAIDHAFVKPAERLRQAFIGDNSDEEQATLSDSDAFFPAVVAHRSSSTSRQSGNSTDQRMLPTGRPDVGAALAANASPTTACGHTPKPISESRRRRGRPKRDVQVNPEELLLLLRHRNPSVVVMSARDLEEEIAREFGKGEKVVSYRTLGKTDLYVAWRKAFNACVKKHGRQWAAAEVLEQGLQIHSGKPGRQDKRPDWDVRHESAVRDLLKVVENAEGSAKERIEARKIAHGK